MLASSAVEWLQKKDSYSAWIRERERVKISERAWSPQSATLRLSCMLGDIPLHRRDGHGCKAPIIGRGLRG